MKLYNFSSCDDIQIDEKNFKIFIVVFPHDKIDTNISFKIRENSPTAEIIGISSGSGPLSDQIQILAIRENFIATKIYDPSKLKNPINFEELPYQGDLFIVADGFRGMAICDFLKDLKLARPFLRTIGALAADDWEFKNTKILYNEQIYQNHILIALFNENFFGPVKRYQSYDIISNFYTITKKQANLLYEVEDIAVLDFFKKTLNQSPEVSTLADFGMAFRRYDSDDIEYRAILGVEENKLKISGSIEEFSSFALAGCNSSKIEDDYRDIFKVEEKNPFNIIIDCAQRLNSIHPHFLFSVKQQKSIQKTLFIRSYGEISFDGLKNYICQKIEFL